MNKTLQTDIENLTNNPNGMLVIRYLNNVPYCQLYLPVFPNYKADDIKNTRETYNINIASLVQNYELYMAIFDEQYMNRSFGYNNDEGYLKIKQEYFTKTLHSIKPHSLNYCQKIDIIIKIAKIIKFVNKQGVAIRSLRPELLCMHKYGENHKQFKLIWMDFPAIIDEDGEIQPDKFNLRDYADFDIYVAPEIKQKKNYRPNVDVWSLGVIFYQLLFGNTNGIAFRKLNAEIQFPNHTPTWLQDVIKMFIEVDPKKRCTIQTCLQYLKPMKCCAESAEKLFPKIPF